MSRDLTKALEPLNRAHQDEAPRAPGVDPAFQATWSHAGDRIQAFLNDLDSHPVHPTLPDAEIRRQVIRRFDFERAQPLSDVVGEVDRLLRNGLVQVTSPRYFGLYNPSVLEAGIVADALVAAYNPQLAARSHAPAAAELEQTVLDYLTGLLGFSPESTHATFTSGGAEANHSAVLAALARRFPHLSGGGLRSLDSLPRIYVSDETHHSFVKIARMTGLGTDALRRVPTTDRFVMDPTALEGLMREDATAGDTPFFVAATAGTTGSGAIDPLPGIARAARGQGAWFHVDAAYGGAAVLSTRLRPLLQGIEEADSVTWDAHKWLSVPMGAGMFFCRHPDAVRHAFSVSASYMPRSGVRRSKGTGGLHRHRTRPTDGYATTMQWSRRAIGLKVLMALAHQGRAGYAALLEHQVAMGDRLRELLEGAGWRIVNDAVLPVVCFTHADLEEGRLATEEILAEIYRRGHVWLSDVRLGCDPPVLRACITSYRTGPSDLRRLIEEVELARVVRTRKLL
jgi:glutamate/tyrosine decarboxylase-like PLP-dependent enzyme